MSEARAPRTSNLMRMSILPERRGVRQDCALHFHCTVHLYACRCGQRDVSTLVVYQEQKSRADHRDMGFIYCKQFLRGQL